MNEINKKRAKINCILSKNYTAWVYFFSNNILCTSTAIKSFVHEQQLNRIAVLKVVMFCPQVDFLYLKLPLNVCKIQTCEYNFTMFVDTPLRMCVCVCVLNINAYSEIKISSASASTSRQIIYVVHNFNTVNLLLFLLKCFFPPFYRFNKTFEALNQFRRYSYK